MILKKDEKAYLKNMIQFQTTLSHIPFFALVAWALVGLSVPSLAFLKLRVNETDITQWSFSFACLTQAVLTAGVLWITALLGPLDAKTVFFTLFFLCAQTVFNLMRRYGK